MKVSYVRIVKGTTIILAVISVFVSCHKSEINPIQILINPDIEGGSLQPNSWTTSGTGSTYLGEWTMEEASSQTHSLKISATNSDSIKFA